MKFFVGFFILGLVVLLVYKNKNRKQKIKSTANLPDFSAINEACARDILPEKRKKSIYRRGCADNKGLQY